MKKKLRLRCVETFNINLFDRMRKNLIKGLKMTSNHNQISFKFRTN